MLGDDFDTHIPVPSRVLASGGESTLGGVRWRVDDAGPGEASCMMMLYALNDNVLFCADVVQHGMTAFLLEGRSRVWKVQAVAARYGSVSAVYPGHGAQGAGDALFTYFS